MMGTKQLFDKHVWPIAWERDQCHHSHAKAFHHQQRRCRKSFRRQLKNQLRQEKCENE